MEGLKKRVLEATAHIDEKCRAVYIASNPEDVTEQWQMVFDENEENCLLKVMHEAVPLSVFDTRMDELRKIYGDVEVLGETYDGTPYSIGIKRMADDDRDEVEYVIRSVYERENYIIKLQDEMQDEPEELDELIEKIYAIPEALYYVTVEPKIQEHLRSALQEMSEDEARNAAALYYLSDSRNDIMMRADFIEQMKSGDNLLKRLNF